MTLPKAISYLRKQRKLGKKIVFTNGCFDLIHAGHVRFLNQAKSLGGVLVVGVNSDASVKRLKGKGRPVLPLSDRIALLEGLKPVDLVVSFSEDTPLRLIQRIKPDVLIKGGDWVADRMVGAEEVREYGGQVVSGIFVKGRSTTGIIRKIKGA